MNHKNIALTLALLLAPVVSVFAQPTSSQPAPVLGTRDRLVFAHYMLCFGSTVEFYKQEIELAQRSGIDGFALNAGDWLQPDGKPGGYVTSAERLFQAAKELNTGFKLFFSPDLTGLRNLPLQIGDMVARFKDHPNALRKDGKMVVSGWSGSPAAYAEAINKIKASGTDVFFVPFADNPRYSANWSPEIVRNFFEGQPHMDGIFYFGIDGVYPEIIRTNATAARVSHSLGKLFMAGIGPAYNSPNLRDFRGMKGYGEMWQGLIQSDADWLEIVTWNDYNEDSNLMPFRWQGGAEKNHISRDEAFLDLTAYYSAWYKSGVQPAITQDKLYYSYRNRSKHQTRAWDLDKKEFFDITRKSRAFDQIHDDVEDSIYVTTHLTAPAELVITQGKTVSKFAMAAGIQHAAVAMQPGVPRFALRRGNAPLLDFWGRKLIIAKETAENSPDGYHLSNRTWGGGAAVGRGTVLQAESGQLSGGATVVKDGNLTAVQTTPSDGSGVLIPVSGLKTGIYNVRLTYSNPAPTEARLTLTADGVPRAEKEYPNFIPAFVPPTAPGQYATTSFFWSLHEGTTNLKLAWLKGYEWGKPKTGNDDIGSIRLDSIELVPVTRVAMPKPADAGSPDMVAIPGGTFTMGSKLGAPDEAPPHQVTLAGFRMGKTEITNLQFEQFAPAHRARRDEFSWRDNDPVIYVSWRDAAGYCNWLSKHHGLAPVYDEKTWQADAKASGYRLPSEAQWEFAASGRGEGRLYPWGNAAPDATHGNFLLRPPGGTGQPASYIGPGTQPVGSFPAGASRDGLLDLAGNVTEWCGDFYNDYPATPQTDPLSQTASHHRVLRGSSWGYYGNSPRTTDREFNSEGYPGYIYVGFRIAAPQGMQ